MPSILSDEDKETVKRQVPKASNKIQAVAVARLYVAYPNRSRWIYTGLQGAIVLANDLVGNTYWLKLVDIAPTGRGVIWDQEIYDTWSYNQDRTFFHTFETEDCLAGLSFVDEKEAKTFLKKMNDREKNASKATKATKFGGSGQPAQRTGLLGGLFGGHRHSSATLQSPPESPSYVLPPAQSVRAPVVQNGERSEFAALDAIDSNWREAWGDDLKGMGITDDLIRDNQDFIADYIREQQAAQGTAPPNAPPPPPPNRDSGYASGVPAPALPQPAGDRANLLAGIQNAGGIRALKKVDKSQVRDRSAAVIPGGDTGPAGSGLPPTGAGGAAGGGGMADALAAALNKRKQKVSASDDESDNDEW
ncbi:hypothetical protein B0O99DRAFT_507493 [Bisporella sp. PMI_857]|nr:hypothetical protein B0O99DRAFT_507493 [Bisporella sp. PMI_857]